MTLHPRALALALVLIATATSAGQPTGRATPVADRIVVRFEPRVLQSLAADDSIDRVIREGRRLAEATGRPELASLDALHARYVREARPLLPGVRTEEDLLQHLASVRARFPLRAGRAPQNARVPVELVGMVSLVLAPGRTVDEALDAFRGDAAVLSAQPSARVEIAAVPNDPYYSSSDSWGQGYDDLWALKKIEMEDAWDITVGSQSVVIAVVDTGADVWFHPDWFDPPVLSGADTNVWVNPGEDPNADGVAECDEMGGYCDWNEVDDDANDYLDDVIGWNFVQNDSTPLDDSFSSHGTHVGGTIAARGNNGVGITGVMWDAKIMAIKVLDHLGAADDGSLFSAVQYAADNGAAIINASWGSFHEPGVYEHSVIKAAVDYAVGLGVLFVAAAGNGTDGPGGTTVRQEVGDGSAGCTDCGFFPASLENVIAVAATDRFDTPCFFSNFGQEIDVAAPGCGLPTETVDTGYQPHWNILSLRSKYFDGSPPFPLAAVGPEPNPDDREYFRFAGTSMAAPHVVGLAGLLLAHHPSLTNDEVTFVLRNGAADVAGPGFDVDTGYGRIDAHQALLLSDVIDAGTFDELELDGLTAETDGHPLYLVARNVSFAVDAEVRNFGADPVSNVAVELYHGDPGQNVVLHTWTIPALAGGAETDLTRNVKFTAADPLGSRFLHVVVDPGNVIPEVVSTNNERRFGVRLVPYLVGSDHVSQNDAPGPNPTDRDVCISEDVLVWRRTGPGFGIYAHDLGPDGAFETGDDVGPIKLTAAVLSVNTRPSISTGRIVWRDSNADVRLYDLGPDGMPGTGDDTGPTVIAVGSGDSPAISGTRIVYQRASMVRLRDLGPDGQFGTGDDSAEITVFPASGTTRAPSISGNRIVALDSGDGVLFYDLGDDGGYGTTDDSGTVLLQSGAAHQINSYEANPRIVGNHVGWIYTPSAGGAAQLWLHDLGHDGSAGTGDDLGPSPVVDVVGLSFAMTERFVAWNGNELGNTALVLHDLGPDRRYGTADDSGAFPALPHETWLVARDAERDRLVFQFDPFPGNMSIGLGTLPVPRTPAGLVATGDDFDILLDWNDSPDPRVETYSVYRSAVSGGPYTRIASGITSSAYTDTSVASAETTYHYVVTAATIALVESDYSAEDAASLTDLGTAGGTPDGADVPGTPLRVAKGPGSQITLTWGDSCLAGDTDFAVYAGTLGNFTGHFPILCSTSGAQSASFAPGVPKRFYLVVPRIAGREGSYGTRSNGSERPPSSTACDPQSTGACP